MLGGCRPDADCRRTVHSSKCTICSLASTQFRSVEICNRVVFISLNGHTQDAAVYWQRRMSAHVREMRTILQHDDKRASIQECYDQACYKLDLLACVISNTLNCPIFCLWLMQYFFTDKSCWIDNSNPTCQQSMSS